MTKELNHLKNYPHEIDDKNMIMYQSEESEIIDYYDDLRFKALEEQVTEICFKWNA